MLNKQLQKEEELLQTERERKEKIRLVQLILQGDFSGYSTIR